MIAQNEADTIKQILGSNYAKKILEYLQKSLIKRPNGSDYIIWDVYNVMNGVRENTAMEKAIYDFIKQFKKDQKEELKRRQAILE